MPVHKLNFALAFRLFGSLICLALVLITSSCGDSSSVDPAVPPTVTGPEPKAAELGETVVFSYKVTIPGGFAETTIITENGSASPPHGMVPGELEGEIIIEFVPHNIGVGAATLIVEDANGNSDEAAAVVNVSVSDPCSCLSGQITEDVTWTSGSIVHLTGLVTVMPGVTLTIEPGVIIKGDAGTGGNMSSLLVARGGKLNALGTANAPIIFTSIADEIQPGEVVSPNLEPHFFGLWGGVVILGNAPVSSSNEHIGMEGIPVSYDNGRYGGSDPNDNSGTLRYVSIRHGGTSIQEVQRMNGLTLGGVGSGTTIEYVEVVGQYDDGLEVLGGTVNIDNVLVWNTHDDAFDLDQVYSGRLENIIAILGPDADHALELDGPEEELAGTFTIQNGSFKGKGAGNELGGEYADLRYDVQCTLNNLYFFNFDEQSDFEFNDNSVAENYLAGEISLSNLQFNVSHLTEGNRTIADIIIEQVDAAMGDEQPLDVFSQISLPPSIAMVTAPTVGADKTAFAGWTWADALGELDDF